MPALPLHGKVAVVAGATRGAGRGNAVALGEAGATVVCTGRSSRPRQLRSDYDRPETIEEVAWRTESPRMPAILADRPWGHGRATAGGAARGVRSSSDDGGSIE